MTWPQQNTYLVQKVQQGLAQVGEPHDLGYNAAEGEELMIEPGQAPRDADRDKQLVGLTNWGNQQLINGLGRKAPPGVFPGGTTYRPPINRYRPPNQHTLWEQITGNAHANFGDQMQQAMGQLWDVNRANQAASLANKQIFAPVAQARAQARAQRSIAGTNAASAQAIARMQADAQLEMERLRQQGMNRSDMIRFTALERALGLGGGNNDGKAQKPMYTSNIGQGINF